MLKFSAEEIWPAKRDGFTLIELLVVVAIIGVLAGIGLSINNSAQERARDTRRKSDLNIMVQALQLYRNDHGRYPRTPSATWLNSNGGGYWITDPGPAPNYPLDGTYLKEPIVDPINNGFPGPAFGYGYYSTDYGSCTAGQFYLLTTHLENASDASAGKPVYWNSCTNNEIWTNWPGYYSLANP